MDNPVVKIREFVAFVRQHLTGDEKGEAQIFCERLFQAFGHAGVFEAGGNLEYRVHKGKTTRFADLLWRPLLLLEMKKRGEKLERHYRQAFDYWLYLVPNRPKYVLLCNFDEFWIYDFNIQLDEPLDRVRLDDLPRRFEAFNFLFPTPKTPLFKNNQVAVTRKAADKMAELFNRLVSRPDKPLPRDKAQHYVLQCVLALFAQSIDLLPHGKFSELLDECKKGGSSYDLIGGLFRQMANSTPAEGGRFQDVQYFNGGLFKVVEPVELNVTDLWHLEEAAKEDWSMVKPAIFGTLFEGSMGEGERHAFGAHFTSEADIQKVVLPTIVRPWRQRIADAKTARDLLDLRQAMLRFRVLDPACGSGNFLYVAYRELKRLELELLEKIYDNFSGRTRELAGGTSLVSASQFFGLDIKQFAVELAKVTLMVGKKLALEECKTRLATGEQHLPFDLTERELPLDNLDENIRCDDALFCAWPAADAIIGNPPYQSKNKMQQELGPDYVQKVRARYPDVPGRADYCVYWFRRAHDELKPGDRAGLVGTNTIRQNYSREGGLDYIVGHGGTITEAVSTAVWSGEAAVHVSIVNWIKGAEAGLKKLIFQKGDNRDSPFEVLELEVINSALSAVMDVTSATRLRVNMECGGCFQGQTHGHEGFLLDLTDAQSLLKRLPKCKDVLFPYLTADEMLGNLDSQPGRFVIDFHRRDVLASRAYDEPFLHLEKTVMQKRQEAAKEEEERNAKVLQDNPNAKVNNHHRNFLNKWWLLSYPRGEMIEKIGGLTRYISCGRVTKRPIFEFISTQIRPSDALAVFAFPDDYSFGVLQSGIHWAWFTAKCSTLTERFRYTSDTVFDTFPWPQAPTSAQARGVADAAVSLRALRRRVMTENQWSLRDLYRTLDLPGKNPLRDAQNDLDAAVRAAYGMKAKADPLAFLLALNQDVAARESAGESVIAPGLPPCVEDAGSFVTDDCIRAQ
ncbi:MAG TPA: DNA methyltransferase [Planctomycetales bacterium]|nr:DNA methyltransferase [Planctomycetales bacterium]